MARNKETASWTCPTCSKTITAQPKDLDTAIYVHQLGHLKDPK